MLHFQKNIFSMRRKVIRQTLYEEEAMKFD